MCQQTLTGLYHNEVSVEPGGRPASRPPLRARIPTGQGSGLCVSLCAKVCRSLFTLWLFRRLRTLFFIFFSGYLLSLLILGLSALTCDKLNRKAVLAVLTTATICLPLFKQCNKSEE